MMNKVDWKQVKFGEVVKLNRERVADPEVEGTTFTNYFRLRQVLFVKRQLK